MEIIKELTDKRLNPISIYYCLKARGTCLFERKAETQDYAIIAFDPVRKLTYQNGNFHNGAESYPCEDPLKELEKYTLKEESDASNLPFQGGALGYVGYDVAACYENIGDIPKDELKLPDLQFYLYESYVVYDKQRQISFLVVGNSYSGDSKEKLERQMDELEQKLQQECAIPDLEIKPLHFTSNFSQAEFEGIVKLAKEKIIEGDLFQVVPSQRLSAEFSMDSFSYYRQLRDSNPSAYLYYLDFSDVQVIGSSPESLVTVEGELVTTNPIAGTRKRGETEKQDEDLAEELQKDPKEVAEHRMLVDLGRNDLGKVAVHGSVTVPTYLTIERYRFVMHLVSVVTGKLKPEHTAIDALKATLPAGTVSGAPKIRAMTRIYQWEKVKRSVYAGAVGFLGQNDQADFAIAIRTMVVKEQKAHVQAGAGIVYDSDPNSEYVETLQKAKALMEVGQ
ncbi:anthranilate synthase component I [Candidatus Enterococcus murrayae]|uniref:Anthranilate synthase component 1 n=1 Tax=Candidatus Enterococcus murrayae TaxID=2815321 RepID=A0ABS3HGD9_9ENTE|nr:anthranilate synthase component I [Enterococcus sp. MJM16]MBO0452516.1 anthranilate synthase component I [Enterococcus sp. MJM16]